MANKHEKCSLETRGVKTTIIYYYTPTRLAKIKMFDIIPH